MKPLGTNAELLEVVNAPPPERAGTLVRAGKPKHRISARSQWVWDRLLDCYGATKMGDFGDWPGPDLCAVIDGMQSRDHLRDFMSNVRNNHPAWPPTLAQMEQIAGALARPGIDWGAMNVELVDHVLRTRTLTPLQRAGKPPWTFAPRGVQIHADGNTPGFFVARDEVK